MRLLLKKDVEGRTSVNWLSVLACVILVPLVVVGGVEVFWYKFTGGFSPLMGGFAAIGSILILIRLIGEVWTRQDRVRGLLQ